MLDGEAGDLADRASDRAPGLAGGRWLADGPSPGEHGHREPPPVEVVDHPGLVGHVGGRLPLLAPTQGGNGNAPAMRAWQNCWAINQLTPLREATSPASPRQIIASSEVISRGDVRVAVRRSSAGQASSRRRTCGSSSGGKSSGLLAPTASMIAWPMPAQSLATTVHSSPRLRRVALIRSRPTRAMMTSVAALSLTAIIR